MIFYKYHLVASSPASCLKVCKKSIDVVPNWLVIANSTIESQWVWNKKIRKCSTKCRHILVKKSTGVIKTSDSPWGCGTWIVAKYRNTLSGVEKWRIRFSYSIICLKDKPKKRESRRKPSWISNQDQLQLIVVVVHIATESVWPRIRIHTKTVLFLKLRSLLCARLANYAIMN